MSDVAAVDEQLLILSGQAPDPLDSLPAGQRDPGAEAGDRLRVLFITEGTFPFHFSGVSTWCRNLITGLPAVDFHILALVESPDLSPMFELPANVSAMTTIPIWGVREGFEIRKSVRLRDLRAARHLPDEQTLADGLGRPLRELVKALFDVSADPLVVAQHVNALYEFFLVHSFDASMRSDAVWKAFVETVQESFPAAARTAGYGDVPLGASDVLTGLHWLYHWLLPLSQRLPDADVAHATMAGECILPAVAAKLHHGAGVVFSEHGVHLREVYLREAADDGSLFLKLLKLGFALRTSEMAYSISDQISTCCDYNKRWQLGNRPSRTQTIHYGLEAVESYRPPLGSDRAPVITWLGRIDPLKDIGTLLRAAAIVHGQRQDAVFRLYGAATPERYAYQEQLLTLRRELGLEDVVELPGYTSDPHTAYAESDIVVLTSISEGFPYATLEAMSCGRPVVATAVGGLPEQLGECGLLVEPQSPEVLAAALVDLIDDPLARAQLGAGARQRVLSTFDLEQKNRLHLEAYLAAANADEPIRVSAYEPAHNDETVELSAAAGRLVEVVAAAVPHPVDHREVAAVLESKGVTDNAAQAQYGFDDTFQLAAAILPHLPHGADDGPPAPHRIESPERERRRIPRFIDGLMLLIPAAVLVYVGVWLSSIDGWTSGASRALLVGIGASTLFGNAFRFSIMRRGALLIGCARWSAARRFLWRWSLVALLSLLCFDLATASAATWLGHLSTAGTVTFGLSFAALTGFWIIGNGLVLTRRAHEVGLATLAGVAVGVAAYYASGRRSTDSIEIALAAGYVVTIACLALRVAALIGHGPSTAVPRLPRLSYLLHEAVPFASYGCLLIVLMLAPSLVTALRAIAGGGQELRSIAVGMTLALAPSILAMPFAERAADALSVRTARVLSDTAIDEADSRIGGALYDSHRRQSVQYVALLALLSLVAGPLIWLTVRDGALARLGIGSTSALLLAYGLSALAYLFLARAQFDLMPAITLGRPGFAVRCALSGLGAMLVVGGVTFALGLAEAGPLTLLAGTSIWCLAAHRASERFFGRFTHHLVGAM
jgi:glycosyltransferase involved in cell wall biosynthesis